MIKAEEFCRLQSRRPQIKRIAQTYFWFGILTDKPVRSLHASSASNISVLLTGGFPPPLKFR
jgi:hypothetical protein